MSPLRPCAPLIIPPPLPPSPLLIATAEEKQKLLTHHRGLELNLSALASCVKQSSESNPDELEKYTAFAQLHLQGLSTFFDTLIEPRFYNEIRPDNSSIAQTTFDVPELFELILDYIDIPDILRVYQVSRGMRDAIEESSRLQTKLCLRPAPANSPFQTPLAFCLNYTWGFSCHHSMPRTNYDSGVCDNKTNVTASFITLPRQPLPRIGSRWRRMLICQPPIYEMEIQTRCCTPSGFPSGSQGGVTIVATVSSPTGLTIGDLYDCTQKTTEEHLLCPNASPHLLSENGIVFVGVHFKGTVGLDPDDPTLTEYRARTAEKIADRNKKKALKTKLRGYSVAKRQARDNGLPIPTLQEFDARVPEYESAWPPF